MSVETKDIHQETAPAFLGLQPYTEAQAGSFFGRDEEINKLTTLLQVNTLTIVFGKSGTGKTSLLNAGVFPRLRKINYLPFRIRLEFNENSPDLVSQIKTVLKTEIDKFGFKVKSYPGAETLWEYFHQEPLWDIITPILVFDQFEEIFTLANLNSRYALTELPAFWQELSDVIENNIPEKLRSRFEHNKEEIKYNYKIQKTKVVFAFREEYLPEFETVAAKIPSIKISRFRLMPMNGYQANDVITKTWKENIKPSESRQIISYLTNDPNKESLDLVTIEPSLLSQVCAYIDEKRIEDGGRKVSAELLKKYPKETILRSIYDEAIKAADDKLRVAAGPDAVIAGSPVKEFLEDKLITTEGFRTRYNLSHKDEAIRPGIGVLQSKYFIREDDNTVELTHDVLAPIIKTDREKRRTGLAMAEERKRSIRKALRILIGSIIIAGLLWLLAGWQSCNAYNRYKTYNDSLQWVKDSISSMRGDSGSKGKPPVVTPHFTGKEALLAEIDRLNEIIKGLNTRISDLESLNAKLRAGDSAKEAEIRSLGKQLAPLQEMILTYRTIIDSKTKENEALDRENNRLLTENKNLGKEKERLKNENEELRRENDLMSRSIKELKEQVLGLQKSLEECMKKRGYSYVPPSITSCQGIDVKNDLRLTLYYTGNQTYSEGIPPDKTHVYLIPYTKANMQTIRRAKVYNSFNEASLASAEGSAKAKYCNGDYYFTGVTRPGKYLVKVCTLYGAYKDYDLKLNGNPHLIVNAVPPVK